MPCQCYYMAPSERERESIEVAEFLLRLRNDFKLEVDGGSKWTKKALREITNSTYGSLEEVDDLTEELCALCRAIETDRELADKVIYDGRSKQSRDLANWWQEHQKLDKKREQRKSRPRAKRRVR